MLGRIFENAQRTLIKDDLKLCFVGRTLNHIVKIRKPIFMNVCYITATNNVTILQKFSNWGMSLDIKVR